MKRQQRQLAGLSDCEHPRQLAGHDASGNRRRRRIGFGGHADSTQLWFAPHEGIYAVCEEIAEATGAALGPFLLERVATDEELMQRDGIRPCHASAGEVAGQRLRGAGAVASRGWSRGRPQPLDLEHFQRFRTARRVDVAFFFELGRDTVRLLFNQQN